MPKFWANVFAGGLGEVLLKTTPAPHGGKPTTLCRSRSFSHVRETRSDHHHQTVTENRVADPRCHASPAPPPRPPVRRPRTAQAPGRHRQPPPGPPECSVDQQGKCSFPEKLVDTACAVFYRILVSTKIWPLAARSWWIPKSCKKWHMRYPPIFL